VNDYIAVERAKPNVIVAYSRDVAIQCRDAFALDPETWACLAYHERLPGKPWQRIALMRPHWSQSPAQAIEFEMYVENWRIARFPDGIFKIISKESP
jgi:hypothetical protein